jgi:cell wall-associated NlpC family hydrolase
VTSRLRDTGRAARTAFFGLSSVALGAALFAAPALPAAAAPPLTVAEARAQIAQLQEDAEVYDQDYLAVKEQVDQAKAKLVLKQEDAKAQAAKVAQLKRQVGQVALAQFQNRNVDTAAQLFLTSDTEGFLSQMSTVEKVGSNQNSVLQTFQQQQASLVDLQKSSQTDLAALEKKESDLAALRAKSDTKLSESKAVLAKLTQQEQDALAAAEKKDSAAAQAAAEGATPTPTADDPSGTSAGTGKGATALAFAKKQIGKPYRFGATGPSAYDCSGLTLAAWKAAGVSLNRTSQAQIRNGRPVAKGDLQPGDLVFFYSGPSHVGLYAGNGMVLHAPRPGKSVEYIKMSYMPFAGARRPG